MLFLALHFHLNPYLSGLILQEEIVGMISFGCYVFPTRKILDDVQGKGAFGNYAAYASKGEVASPMNCVDNDFGSGIQLRLNRVNGEFLTQLSEDLVPFFLAARVEQMFYLT
jgi:hypothetical protein